MRGGVDRGWNPARRLGLGARAARWHSTYNGGQGGCVDGADARTTARPLRDDAQLGAAALSPQASLKKKGGGMMTATSCRRQRDVTWVPPVSWCCPSVVGGGVRGPSLG
jgi:hypothetical protein